MSTTLVIGVCGDSITGNKTRWIQQAVGGVTPLITFGTAATQAGVTTINGRMTLRNMAIAGTSLGGTNGVATVRPAYVDPMYAVKTLSPSNPGGVSATPRKYLYINAIGSNDGAIGGLGTVAAYAAAVAADIAAAKTAGANYGWICSLMPRADGGAALNETNRLAYNALVTNASWLASNGVDGCIDLASATHGQPANLPANNGGDTTWFNADNIHPQDALSAEMGVIALAKLIALLATI